ncbi:hypothetical protein DPEC_G00239400 [Dallia pectoralis]|uniref:Uncharacterized protein n=1 Tax=Dallia pectoralis TaxID=75939 RepID=A0ACC2FZD6_DALPE|nr:hypothetical protein DPEC_G00239400 [Dallia pectoralis]
MNAFGPWLPSRSTGTGLILITPPIYAVNLRSRLISKTQTCREKVGLDLPWVSAGKRARQKRDDGSGKAKYFWENKKPYTRECEETKITVGSR